MFCARHPERFSSSVRGARLLWSVFAIGLGLGIIWLYQNALFGYFLSDDLSDLHYVAGLMNEGDRWTQFLTMFVSRVPADAFFYRPLLIALFAVDFLLWGLNAFGWHVTNLALHLINALLLARLVCSLIRPVHDARALIAGGAAAILFATRPTAPETVVWFVGRVDSLALLGMLIALLAYLRAEGKWNGAYLVACGGFLFALGSKEAGVTLPGGLAALHLAGAIPLAMPPGEPYWRAWVRQVTVGVGPFLVLLMLYFVWRFFLFGSFFRVYQYVPPIDPLNPDWWATKLHALRVFLAPSLVLTPLSASFAGLVVVTATLGGFAAWRSAAARRVWLFGLMWLGVTLLPLAQQLAIAPTGESARLLYIPSAALCVLLAAPLAALTPATQQGVGEVRVLGEAGLGGVCLLAVFSLLLHAEFLEPWVVAGKNMRVVPAAVAQRAESLSAGGFAVLSLPDHVGGALFARNAQGPLMGPPVQQRSLFDRVLVVTPETLVQHGPRLATPAHPIFDIERWCWSVETRRFERLSIPDHTPELWRLAWLSALQRSSCRHVAQEVAELSP